MKKDFAELFKPGRIGKLEVRNRIALAPHGTLMANLDGSCSRRLIDYLAERARGGTGLIITEGVKMDRALDPSPHFAPFSIDSDAFVPSMADLTSELHFYGAKAMIQIFVAFGRQASEIDLQNPPKAPSAIPAFGNPDVTCRALSVEEIKQFVAAFGVATKRAIMAGFDAVEIHAHTGYLVDQFMTSLWNKRTDEYGGDLKGRMRFALELVKSAREEAGPGFPIGFRYSVTHGIPEGRSTEESQQIARYLEAAGVDILSLDVGSYEAMDHATPPVYFGDGPWIDLAAAIKKVVNIPVMVAGNTTPEAAENAIASGKVDFIASARGLIADPHWPNKVRRGHREDVRPCIQCNEMCMGNIFSLKPISCSVNPAVGVERYREIYKVDITRKVLIIGGGPAGMEAARVAALRGHDVTLLEKNGFLGGHLKAAAASVFKKPLRDLIAYWETQLSRLKVDVRLNTDVTTAMLDDFKADAVVLACGGKPCLPLILGINGENVVEVIDYHLGRKTVQSQTVVIAGGGLSGCDAALDLAMQGKTVTVVEMMNKVATNINPVSRMALLRQLAERRVNILTNHRVEEFRSDGLVVKGPHGDDKFIEADKVIVAFGVKSDSALAEEINKRWDEVYAVGDCVEPAMVGRAVHAGFAAGWQI